MFGSKTLHRWSQQETAFISVSVLQILPLDFHYSLDRSGPLTCILSATFSFNEMKYIFATPLTDR